MANPQNHMNTLSTNLYSKLQIDTLLIQNYDGGNNYMTMIDKSIEWKQKLKSNYKLMLMLPFFAVKVNGGSISAKDSVKSLQNYGIATASITPDGLCNFV